ncbi:MAG TPA: hypothetical protein VGE52_00070 [Pirellulales bacterium]
MLLQENDLIYAGAGVAAASNTDSNSTRIDMAGYEEVTFFTTIIDSVATGVAHLKVEGNSADSDSGMALLEAADGTDADATLTCAVNDDVNGKVLAVTVRNPRTRYVQGVRTSATANIQFGEIYAVRSKPKVQPVTAHSTIGHKVEIVD